MWLGSTKGVIWFLYCMPEFYRVYGIRFGILCITLVRFHKVFNPIIQRDMFGTQPLERDYTKDATVQHILSKS